jgi:hypothetical protein
MLSITNKYFLLIVVIVNVVILSVVAPKIEVTQTKLTQMAE